MSDFDDSFDVLEFWAHQNSGHKSKKPKKVSSRESNKLSGDRGSSGSGGDGSNRSKKQDSSVSTGLNRSDFVRMVNGSAEVVVKISKCSNDQKAIRGYMRYITKNGEVELEDNMGHLYEKKDIPDIVGMWNNSRDDHIPSANGTKRESLNIILSVKKGTNREGLRQAASTFAAKTFPDHEYVFAAHNDTEAPHVHLVVSMGNLDGVRLNPRKADLQQWRRSFASELRDNGIDANATPRRARGVIHKQRNQAVMNLDKEANETLKAEGHTGRGFSRNSKENMLEAILEIEGKPSKRKKSELEEAADAKAAIQRNRKNINSEYLFIHTGLSESDSPSDRDLADRLVGFLKNMPSVKTRQERLVDNQRVRMQQKIEADIEEKPSPKPAVTQKGPKL